MADEESTSGSLGDVLSDLQADLAAGSLGSLAEYVTRSPEHGEEIATAYLAAKRDQQSSDDEDRIGNYRLIRELGRGGQAVVWLAEDEKLHRKVALKIIQGLGPDAHRLLKRFRREAELMSKLDHPGICAVLEVGTDAVPFIAMRYVEGAPLSLSLIHI